MSWARLRRECSSFGCASAPGRNLSRAFPAHFAAITVLCGVTLLAAGCKPSPYVRATITNASGDTLQQLELDYPSASFGKDKLAGDAVYSYRFKIQGGGKPHIQFQDSSGNQHQADGPDLREGENGTLDIRIAPAYSVSWQADLHR